MSIFLLLVPSFISAQESKGISETIKGYPFNYPIKISNDAYIYATGKYSEASGLDLVKFNSSLQVIWKKSLPDGVISISRIADKIAVFSSKEWAKNTYSNIKTIHITLIDPNTSTILLEKDILTIDDKFFVDPSVLTDSVKNFKGLILRYTNMEQVKMFSAAKVLDKKEETQRIDWIMLDEKMNVKSTITLNNNYAASEVVLITGNSLGDLFIASMSENKVIIDKYSAGESDKAATLSANLSQSSGKGYESFGVRKTSDDQNLLCSVCYRTTDKTINTLVAKFDFAQNKVFSSSTDPKVLMGLEKFKAGSESIDLIGTAYYNENLIMMQQYTTTSMDARTKSTSTLYNSSDMLVSFFDEKMHAVKQLTIKEYFPTYEYMGKRPGFKILGNKLIILTDVFDGKKIFNPKYKFRYIVIDLDKLEIEKDSTIDVNNRFNSIVDASLTTWINNDAVIFHLTDTNAFSRKDFAVKLEKLEFVF